MHLLPRGRVLHLRRSASAVAVLRDASVCVLLSLLLDLECRDGCSEETMRYIWEGEAVRWSSGGEASLAKGPVGGRDALASSVELVVVNPPEEKVVMGKEECRFKH